MLRLSAGLLSLLAMPHSTDVNDDPIERLVKQLNRSGGLWVNGATPLVHYPRGTEIAVLVRKVLDGYDWGKGQPYRILDQRQVEITSPPGQAPYVAVLVETEQVRRILLLQFQRDEQWWSRVLEVPSF